jgi:threonyl-tRNA synthetase
MILIEHFAGRFPVWLAPEQIRVVSVNQEKDTLALIEKIVVRAKEMGLRLSVDNTNESVGKKIRTSEVLRVPYTVVVGQKEVESGNILPRIRKDMEVQPLTEPLSIEDFLKTVANEAKTRVLKSSL